MVPDVWVENYFYVRIVEVLVKALLMIGTGLNIGDVFGCLVPY